MLSSHRLLPHEPNHRDVVIAGGGAAGFFAAISCAELCPGARVTLLEQSSQFLSKVRISGGGRCNVTHACFDPRELSRYYPRGGSALIGPFTFFQPRDTIAWFEHRGVKLKTEADGRIFPVTDSSETVIECLLRTAKAAGVDLLPNHGLKSTTRTEAGTFDVVLTSGGTLQCDRLMLATGGCRSAGLCHFASSLGHAIEPPVPSLFTFHIALPWLRELAGISIESAEVSVPGSGLHDRGPLLVTHNGLSGPAILRLSAWGARSLHGLNYQFPLRVNWLPNRDQDSVAANLATHRKAHPARFLVNSPLPPLPARLWEALVLAAGVSPQTRCAELSRAKQHELIQFLLGAELPVSGKSMNKEEFVTCGGVRLSEVNFKTMESRLCPGLYFGGEILDIDGLTGGFNFQAAWTTGWLAGNAIARAIEVQ